MAAIHISENNIVCISRSHIITYSIGDPQCHVYMNQKPQIAANKTDQPKGIEEGSLKILASGFSRSGHYFVTCDDYKQVTLWDVKAQESWSQISRRSSARRVTSLTFTRDDSDVLVADKSGDVYRFSIDRPRDEGQLLMGHVSMLLDVVLIYKDRLLATCDRDEKIRISNYPDAYSIHSYCLGHRDFVTQLVCVEDDDDVIISGSGDGTLRVWHCLRGRQLAQSDCRARLAEYAGSPDHESRIRTPSDGGEGDATGAATKRRQRNNEGLDLKRLVCNSSDKLVVVGFERLPVLLVYKYESRPASGERAELTFVQEVKLRGDFWDMTFDGKGQLWVLQAFEENVLQVYETSTSTAQLTPVETTNDKYNIKPTIRAICQQWPLFKDCIGDAGFFSVLHKMRIDNAEEYRERKQQRLAEQQQRHLAKKERKRRSQEVATSSESRVHHRAAGGDDPGSSPSGNKKNKLIE